MELNRLPPQDLEAEQAVLGSILLSDSALIRVLDILKPDHFYREAHKTIYQVMIDLYQEQGTVDIILVVSQLKSINRLDEVGGPAYISQLTDIVPSSANIVRYARLVSGKHVARRAIQIGQELMAAGHEEDTKVALNTTVKQISELSIFRRNTDFKRMDVGKQFKAIEERYHHKEELIGISTGYERIDQSTGGLEPSDLIIIAGRPSMGKTALALNMAENAALNGDAAAVFSMEMSESQLTQRSLARASKINSMILRSGRLRDEHWPRLTRAAGELESIPLFIDETPGLTALELCAKARRLKSTENIKLLVVDYLQLMRGANKSREQDVSEFTRTLKGLAKELHIPVIALSQLNRNLESRPNKRPILSDLRESGSIEQDSDIIMFIYRDEIYNKAEDNPNRGIAEIIIGKQRRGPTVIIKLSFLEQYTTFENLAY